MIAKYPQAYCTLNSVIQQLNLDSSTNVTLAGAQTTIVNTLTANDKAYLKRLIIGVSDIISANQNRSFLPYVASHKLRSRQLYETLIMRGNESFIRLPDDLLSITSVNWNGTTLTADTDYRLADEYVYPNSRIAISSSKAVPLVSFDDYVTITGTWGYHRNADRLFSTSSATVGTTINTTSTSLVVSDSDVFEVYQYIKIDSEYLFITDITSATDTLTVERGALGTTAASHVSTTAISTFNHTPQVEQVVRRMVIKLFNLRGEIGNVVVLADNAYQIVDEKFILNLHHIGFEVS